MLRGQALLNPVKKEDGQPDKGKLWPMPPEADLRKGFQSYERDAFAGSAGARNAMYQASLAIYAAKSAAVGDASGVLDFGRWEDAMRLAIGGIEKYNGKAIMLPYGYDYGQFRDELAKRIDTIFESGRLPRKGILTHEGTARSKLHSAPLESVGDGRYVFRFGDGVLVDEKTGLPIVVDFNISTPFRTSGDRMIPKDTEPSAAELEEARKPATGRAIARKRTTKTAAK